MGANLYLPNEIPNAKVLITVKTYPRPTPTYEEIVCTAGLLENGKWIRIYPIPFRNLPFIDQFSKFTWIGLNLIKQSSDFRLESYRPKQMYDEKIIVENSVGTKKNWLERKRLVQKEVFSSMDQVINLAYKESRSLVTLKPNEIIGFAVEKEKDRDWDPKYINRLSQMKLFEKPESRQIIKKLPYKYYYRFITDGDTQPRKLMIHDWEIGALYWNCLSQTKGDEVAANELVKQKYFHDFATTKDISFFLGTTYQYQKKKAPNPFSIIGVFPPPKTAQIPMSF